jgi:hypothetical protein
MDYERICKACEVLPIQPAATIHVLAWAIEAEWNNGYNVEEFVKNFESVSAKHIDQGYALAEYFHVETTFYQDFKKRYIYPHIDKASEYFYYYNNRDLEMTPEDRELLNAINTKLDQVLAQFGPSPVGSTSTDPHWPSWGLNANGEQLTLRDGLLSKLNQLLKKVGA